jgi:hypothetical protein
LENIKFHIQTPLLSYFCTWDPTFSGNRKRRKVKDVSSKDCRYREHEWLLRNISTVSNLVWGTSSHHIQRFEVFGETPIIYGMGDFLFRHVVGVEDFCPLYAVPCESYRPDLSLAYQFEIVWDEKSGRHRIDLSRMRAWPTQHSLNQTQLLTAPQDLEWVHQIFNELSGPFVTSNSTLPLAHLI